MAWVVDVVDFQYHVGEFRVLVLEDCACAVEASLVGLGLSGVAEEKAGSLM